MNASAPSIYIIILSWNNLTELLACLESVHAVDYPNCHVVVVDNASDDDIGSCVCRAYPSTVFIQNEANLGFAGGCNVGLRYALEEGASYLFLLNQDTIVATDLFTRLIDVAENQPKSAIWGPKTYSLNSGTNDEPRLMYTGSWRRWVPLQQRIPGIGQVDDGGYDTNRATDYVWGHGMLIRASMLAEIGLLDEDFFFYYEDIELCHRASQAGYELWYVADAQMWHNVDDGARAQASELWRWRYKAHGIGLFYRKHYGRLRGPALTAVTILDMCLHMLKKGQWQAAYHLGRSWVEQCLGALTSFESA